jgi:hypothetical protein
MMAAVRQVVEDFLEFIEYLEEEFPELGNSLKNRNQMCRIEWRGGD